MKKKLKLVIDEAIETTRVKQAPDSDPEEFNTDVKRTTKRLALGAGLLVGAIAAAAIAWKVTNGTTEDEIDADPEDTPTED